MKSKTSLHFAIAFSCGVFIFICLLIIRGLDGGSSKLQSQLEKIADETGKDLPKMLDSGTRWDSVRAVEQALVNSYTLIHVNKGDIEHSVFVRTMQASLLERLCGKPELDFLTDNDVSVVYSYNDKEGVNVAILHFNTSDCSRAS